MKKLLLFVAIAIFGIASTSAQVKLGFGLGYAFPSGDISDFTDGGISAHFELGYGVTEDIDVSFYYQGDFLVGASVSQDGTTGSIGNVALGSYLLNGRYFFTKEGFRPYGSLGLGITSVGAIEIDGGEDSPFSVEGSSNFAIRPALGFKYKVLNFNVAYLNAGKAGDASVSDFTINIGLLFTIGGGK